MIDITMTATIRPDIVECTLSSLKKNLITKRRLRLIVDIAPTGDPAYTQKDVADVVQKYFDFVFIRSFPESKQAEALKWTWSRSETDYILQWEDDWVLEKRIDLDRAIQRMSDNIGVLCFDRKGKSVLNYAGYNGSFIPFSPQVWYRTQGASLGGPPAVMRRAYVQDVLPIIDGNVCLDILSKNGCAKPILNKWSTAVYLGEDAKGNLVQDIGKQWRAERNLIMRKDTARGVTWIQK